MPLVDSHCHLHLMDLTEFHHQLEPVLQLAKAADVQHLLCVSVDLDAYDKLCALAQQHPDFISISVGVHPDHTMPTEPTVAQLMQHAAQPGCIAIGETGLDYFRVQDPAAIALQQQRFRDHIHVAKQTQKPLIIHTRQAAADTISYLKTEKAETVGGVMHCFTESWEIATAAMDLGFYISFSGIVTFKNARDLQETAQKMPLDRILIETDSPYLAPTPFRGKQNHPALVKHVAEALAVLRNTSFEEIAEATTANFYRCFKK